MQFLGIYTSVKLFIINMMENWYAFMKSTDDFIESMNYETFQMWVMIGGVIALIIIGLGSWAISKIENTPAERAKEKDVKKNNHQYTI